MPFDCICKKGTFGGLCGKKITKFRCKSYSGGLDYKCNECIPGFSGKYCQMKSCDGLDMCKNGGKIFLNKGTCKVENGKRFCVCPAYSHGDFCEKLKCEFCETPNCQITNKCETCFNTTTTPHEVCKYFSCENYEICKNDGKIR